MRGEGDHRAEVGLHKVGTKVNLSVVESKRGGNLITPCASELRQVNVKLGLAEPATVDQAARWVRHALKLGLRDDVLLYRLLQARVVLVGGVVLDQRLKHQPAVSGPGVEVYEASVITNSHGAWGGGGLCISVQSGSFLEGDATTTPGSAPAALQPSAPMLQSSCSRANAFSVSMYSEIGAVPVGHAAARRAPKRNTVEVEMRMATEGSAVSAGE